MVVEHMLAAIILVSEQSKVMIVTSSYFMNVTKVVKMEIKLKPDLQGLENPNDKQK